MLTKGKVELYEENKLLRKLVDDLKIVLMLYNDIKSRYKEVLDKNDELLEKCKLLKVEKELLETKLLKKRRINENTKTL